MNAFEKMRQGMYFNPYADEIPGAGDVKEALVILHMYVGCQAKEHEAKDALKSLVAAKGNSVRHAARDFWRWMSYEDEDYRLAVCRRCHLCPDRCLVQASAVFSQPDRKNRGVTGIDPQGHSDLGSASRH